ncbi:hypothetical protein HYX12_01230 [Candidatus Woesearchaeota archaeon]|nr:hypothetical protein [Candidatus Woesearchaeota archaeon]
MLLLPSLLYKTYGLFVGCGTEELDPLGLNPASSYFGSLWSGFSRSIHYTTPVKWSVVSTGHVGAEDIYDKLYWSQHKGCFLYQRERYTSDSRTTNLGEVQEGRAVYTYLERHEAPFGRNSPYSPPDVPRTFRKQERDRYIETLEFFSSRGFLLRRIRKERIILDRTRPNERYDTLKEKKGRVILSSSLDRIVREHRVVDGLGKVVQI